MASEEIYLNEILFQFQASIAQIYNTRTTYLMQYYMLPQKCWIKFLIND